MKNERSNILRSLLLVGILSTLVMIPMQSNAQIAGKTHGDKIGNDANDDEKFCSDAQRRLNSKFCDYYFEYKLNLGTNNVKAAEIRNTMIDLLKVQIDDYYNDHKNGRVTKTKWFQTVLDILGIGLAFTGNIVGGVRDKTVLAATAGSFQAGRNSLNDRFHLLQHQILINKMNSNRLDQWARIVARKKDTVGDFSWDNAKAELQQYLFRGSFTDALDSLVEDTGAQVQNAQANLNVVLAAVSQTSLAAKLTNFTGYVTPLNTAARKLDADILAKQGEIAAARLEAGIAVGAALPDPVPAAVAAKIAEKKALEDKRKSLLENYKNIFLAIKASSDFAVIDQKVRAMYGAVPAVMTPWDNVFNNIQTNPAAITFRDYDFALTSVNEFAGADAEMNKRFLEILTQFKI